jgi:hypothetical protein
MEVRDGSELLISGNPFDASWDWYRGSFFGGFVGFFFAWYSLMPSDVRRRNNTWYSQTLNTLRIDKKAVTLSPYCLPRRS